MSRHADILIVQQVAVESPGLILDALDAEGLGHRVVRSGEGEPVPATIETARRLVIMGGPMGVGDADRLPFLRDEMWLIEDTLRRERPVLGICLGSQLLAAVLGANVVRGQGKEIGWLPVRVETGAARADAHFADLPETFGPLHWHGDVFDLPEGATRLARSATTATQAFRYGEGTYGLLFHFEVTPRIVADMTRAFDDELQEAGRVVYDVHDREELRPSEASARVTSDDALGAALVGARRARQSHISWRGGRSRRAEGAG